MSWDLLNDDVRELIFKMKTTMEIEDKFKREHRDKMAEAFDLIKIRGKKRDFEMEFYPPRRDEYYYFFRNEVCDYFDKYGRTEDYEKHEELGDLWAVFMHVYPYAVQGLDWLYF